MPGGDRKIGVIMSGNVEVQRFLGLSYFLVLVVAIGEWEQVDRQSVIEPHAYTVGFAQLRLETGDRSGATVARSIGSSMPWSASPDPTRTLTDQGKPPTR